MPDIPPRNPVGDLFNGVILEYSSATCMALSPLDETHIKAKGDFVVRYGIRYIERPHLSIVPGLLAVDYGDIYTGEEMWNFILNRSNAYPRAEIFGYQNDGEDTMIVVKKLDLAQPIQVLVFPDENSNVPIAMPQALIALETNAIAQRITQYLPTFATLEDWISHE